MPQREYTEIVKAGKVDLKTGIIRLVLLFS